MRASPNRGSNSHHYHPLNGSHHSKTHPWVHPSATKFPALTYATPTKPAIPPKLQRNSSMRPRIAASSTPRQITTTSRTCGSASRTWCGEMAPASRAARRRRMAGSRIMPMRRCRSIRALCRMPRIRLQVPAVLIIRRQRGTPRQHLLPLEHPLPSPRQHGREVVAGASNLAVCSMLLFLGFFLLVCSGYFCISRGAVGSWNSME